MSLSPTSTNEDEHFIMEDHLCSNNNSQITNHINVQQQHTNNLDIINYNPAVARSRQSSKVNSPPHTKRILSTDSKKESRNPTSNKNKTNTDKSSKHLLISSSLSLSSSVASSSVPSSISPSATSSPRSFQLTSQSTSSNTLLSNNNTESLVKSTVINNASNADSSVQQKSSNQNK